MPTSWNWALVTMAGNAYLHPDGFALVLGVRAPDQDISYPIDTKNLGIHGRLGLKAVDHDDCSQSLGWFNPPRAGLIGR